MLILVLVLIFHRPLFKGIQLLLGLVFVLAIMPWCLYRKVFFGEDL